MSQMRKKGALPASSLTPGPAQEGGGRSCLTHFQATTEALRKQPVTAALSVRGQACHQPAPTPVTPTTTSHQEGAQMPPPRQNVNEPRLGEEGRESQNVLLSSQSRRWGRWLGR